VDQSYLHLNKDGIKATVDVHFEKLSKEESVRIWAERIKEEGKRTTRHPPANCTVHTYAFDLGLTNRFQPVWNFPHL
jgi:hypothetical protein